MITVSGKEVNRGDIETREQFVKRNIKWWVESHSHESIVRKPYYDAFIKYGNILSILDGAQVIGEVGAGPFGGCIEVCSLPADGKFFIDYIQQELCDLNFIDWPEDAIYINAPAEDIPLLDNSIDVLLSYNCLDHGWDVYKCIKECIRISKRCFLSFDCRGDNEKEIKVREDGHDLDHVQLLKYKDIENFVNEELKSFVEVTLSDMKTKHFPVVFMEVKK
jgi:hypothetical protein